MTDKRDTRRDDGDRPRDPYRRRVLTGLAAGAGALALTGCGAGGDNGSPYSVGGGGESPESQSLPDPQDSGIEHFVVLMMENRSFDHMLGWLPGADGRPAGLQYPDREGRLHSPYHLTDSANCGHSSPGQGMDTGRQEYNNGQLNGFLTESRIDNNDLFPIGYYEAEDLNFLGKAAPAWTSLDRYFPSAMMSTFPNRVFMHAGQTDRLSNYIQPFCTLPTIWDRLHEKGLMGKYYYGNIPIISLWGNRYADMPSHFYDQFFEDAASGNLGHVNFVDPIIVTKDGGPGNSDHPFDDVRSGAYFMNQVYNAVVNSPNWRNTVLIINFDEWGGFFDHVTPPFLPIPEATKKAALGPAPEGESDFSYLVDGQAGFRVPALMISPLARRHYVSHMRFDHTSILKMIEWRFGLEPLSIRDRTANNLAHALDFKQPKNLDAPRFNVPKGPEKYGVFGELCLPAGGGLRKFRDPRFQDLHNFQALRDNAKELGFRVL